jgi:thiaminase/transcriptional activator TenA
VAPDEDRLVRSPVAVSAVATPTCNMLRESCRHVWQSLLDHPFVYELAAGTLPLWKFRFYLEQDILVLNDYARAIGLGISRADDEELRELTKQLQIVVGSELDSEWDLLRRVDELAGRRNGPAVRPATTTIAYTSFLLATAARGDALDVMTALMPCAWSYADIGLAHAGEAAEHPIYSDWLRFFGSADYVDSVDERRATLDRIVARSAHARHARLYQLFTIATRLERAFWDMAYAVEET